MADLKRAFLKILLGTAAGLALAEGAFRLRDHGAFPHLNVYVADAELGARLRPHAEERVGIGNNPVSSVRINAEGYRGGDWPAPGGDEVLVVGDSMAFGLGVEEGEAFSARLEKDVCAWKAGEVGAYAAKAKALAEYAKGRDLPLAARTLADHVHLFGEWLAAADRAQSGRGTARLFQDLVLAYDAYQPEQKLDPDPPGIVKQYTESFGDPHVHYIWSTPYIPEPGARAITPYQVHQGLPRPLRWRNGAQGPFLGD
jgi:hypothetical protein